MLARAPICSFSQSLTLKITQSLTRRPRLGLEVSCNQPCAFVETEISPRPLKKHGETIAKSNEEDDVHEQPGQPGRKAAEMQQFQIGDSFVSSNRGHAAFIPIPKLLRLASFKRGQDVARRMTALLHRDRRNTGQGLAGLMRKVCQISDHLDFRMTGNR